MTICLKIEKPVCDQRVGGVLYGDTADLNPTNNRNRPPRSFAAHLLSTCLWRRWRWCCPTFPWTGTQCTLSNKWSGVDSTSPCQLTIVTRMSRFFCWTTGKANVDYEDTRGHSPLHSTPPMIPFLIALTLSAFCWKMGPMWNLLTMMDSLRCKWSAKDASTKIQQMLSDFYWTTGPTPVQR